MPTFAIEISINSIQQSPEAFVEPVSVGATLPDMPLFLTPETYVPVPLEATYRSAWETLPAYWRERLTMA